MAGRSRTPDDPIEQLGREIDDDLAAIDRHSAEHRARQFERSSSVGRKFIKVQQMLLERYGKQGHWGKWLKARNVAARRVSAPRCRTSPARDPSRGCCARAG